MGDYTSKTILQEIVTVLIGVQRKLGSGVEVLHVKGCNTTGDKLDQIREAQDAARKSQAAILVVGEDHRRNGEGKDVASLDLPGMQEELVRAVIATGTPTVVVLINGRALSVRWIAEHAPAVVEAWLPGEQGGNAVADVLFGDVNPSGRLPVSFPRHAGQLPVYYNFTLTKASKMARQAYVDMPATPLWEFGYGLSYKNYEYGDLRIAPQRIAPDGSARVSVRVKNTGSRAGSEVVQLYLRDVVSSVSQPAKQLRGFEKVHLQPGEAKDVQFTLAFDALSLLDETMNRVVEAGEFQIQMGASSNDIRAQGSLVVQN